MNFNFKKNHFIWKTLIDWVFLFFKETLKIGMFFI